MSCAGIVDEQERSHSLLSYRQRRQSGTGQERGWGCDIAKSTDVVRFVQIWSLLKAELGSSSRERSTLLPAPIGGYFRYMRHVDPADDSCRVGVLQEPEAGVDNTVIDAALPGDRLPSVGARCHRDRNPLTTGECTALHLADTTLRPDSAGRHL